MSLELLLVILALIVCCCYRRVVGPPTPPVRVDVQLPVAADALTPRHSRPPSAGELLTLNDWGFDYERMVLASPLAPRQRELTLVLLNQFILPLVGHMRVCEVDDELARSVGRVLEAQLPYGERPFAAKRWLHFIGWVRYSAAPPEERDMWASLDAEGNRVYDEYADG